MSKVDGVIDEDKFLHCVHVGLGFQCGNWSECAELDDEASESSATGTDDGSRHDQ